MKTPVRWLRKNILLRFLLIVSFLVWMKTIHSHFFFGKKSKLMTIPYKIKLMKKYSKRKRHTYQFLLKPANDIRQIDQFVVCHLDEFNAIQLLNNGTV